MKVKQLKALLESIPDESSVYVSIEEKREIGHGGMYGYKKYHTEAQKLGEISISKNGVVVKGSAE